MNDPITLLRIRQLGKRDWLTDRACMLAGKPLVASRTRSRSPTQSDGRRKARSSTTYDSSVSSAVARAGESQLIVSMTNSHMLVLRQHELNCTSRANAERTRQFPHNPNSSSLCSGITSLIAAHATAHRIQAAAILFTGAGRMNVGMIHAYARATSTWVAAATGGKLMRVVGLCLVIIGALLLGYQGFTYISRETVVDVGPVKVSADRERTVWIPPVIGGVAVVAGLVLMVSGGRKVG